MIQGTDDWYKARLGSITASRIADVITGTADKRRNYMHQLALERLTGVAHDTIPTTFAMARGMDLEATARIAFCAHTGLSVQQTGFIKDLTIDGLGCSPDGITSDASILEIKCPNSTQHIAYYREKRLPLKYRAQVMCQLAVTGMQHAYFVSYDDRVPVHLQLSIVKVQRDEDYIQDMLSKSRIFLAELESLMEDFARDEKDYMQRLAL